MTKARTLADFISDGSPLADGTISVSEVSGAAPLASPTFTGTVTSTGNIVLGDNDRAIFGDGSDLQIFHNATDSIIADTGDGELRLRTNGAGVRLQSTSDENLANFAINGAVTLYHNNAPKLATTSTGVDITGQVDVNSAARIDSSGIVKAANGTEAAPTHSFLNDPDNGMFRPTTNTVGFSTAGSEAMRIDSSGNIKFGPNGEGYINGAAQNTYNSGFNVNTDDFSTWINYSGYQGGTTKFRDLIIGDGKGGRVATIDGSSGNVGIGTTSLTNTSNYKTLSINGTSGGQISFQTGGVGKQFIFSSSTDLNIYNQEAGNIEFTTDSTERMRIDSSGNLLVGKTSSSATTQGIEARADGRLWVSTSSDDSIFNRAGTDGGILSFRKDGSTVGSIGTYSSDFYIGNPDEALIRFGNEQVVPANNTGADRDAAIDLGGSGGRRFRDLFLSGSAYVGDKIIHDGDTDTYMQFNSANSWRVVTGNSERLVVNNSQVSIKNGLTVSNGDITLSGTGRIQGVDTVSSGTDAANKNYVDTAVASAGGDEQTATTTSTSQTAIATYTASSSLGLEITVIATNTVTTERTITKLLVTHDNTTAVATEYGTVNTDATIATFDVDISGGNVRLLATAASTNSTNYTAKAVILA